MPVNTFMSAVNVLLTFNLCNEALSVSVWGEHKPAGISFCSQGQSSRSNITKILITCSVTRNASVSDAHCYSTFRTKAPDTRSRNRHHTTSNVVDCLRAAEADNDARSRVHWHEKLALETGVEFRPIVSISGAGFWFVCQVP